MQQTLSRKVEREYYMHIWCKCDWCYLMDGSKRLLTVFVLTSTSAICMQALLLVDNDVITRMVSDGLVVLASSDISHVWHGNCNNNYCFSVWALFVGVVQITNMMYVCVCGTICLISRELHCVLVNVKLLLWCVLYSINMLFTIAAIHASAVSVQKRRLFHADCMYSAVLTLQSVFWTSVQWLHERENVVRTMIVVYCRCHKLCLLLYLNSVCYWKWKLS